MIRAYFVILGITSSTAGWLADTRIGRYKVVHTSNWIMWIAAVIATTSSVVAHLYESYVSFHSYLVAVAFFTMAVGLGGFQATIIQFGLDQLHDASTSEIKSVCVVSVLPGHSYVLALIIGHPKFTSFYLYAEIAL